MPWLFHWDLQYGLGAQMSLTRLFQYSLWPWDTTTDFMAHFLHTMIMGNCHRYFIPHCGHGTTHYGHGTLPSLFHPTLWAWDNILWPWDTAIAISSHTVGMEQHTMAMGHCHRCFITHYGHANWLPSLFHYTLWPWNSTTAAVAISLGISLLPWDIATAAMVISLEIPLSELTKETSFFSVAFSDVFLLLCSLALLVRPSGWSAAKIPQQCHTLSHFK